MINKLRISGLPNVLLQPGERIPRVEAGVPSARDARLRFVGLL